MIKGTAHKYGDNVDTDVIIPARYLVTTDPQELAAHCMEDIDAGFRQRMQHGDVMVGGKNFGCGSSREQAPIAIKTAGVACVVAESFARIFYRNAINIGLPLLVAPEAAQAITSGDQVEIDLATGTVKDLTQGRQWQSAPFPEFIRQIIDAGGLIEYTRRRLQQEGKIAG